MNPSKPAKFTRGASKAPRYWPGQAPAAPEEAEALPLEPATVVLATAPISIALSGKIRPDRDVSGQDPPRLAADHEESSDEEALHRRSRLRARLLAQQAQARAQQITSPEASDAESDHASQESTAETATHTESSEYTTTDSEQAARPLFKPVFIPKNQRTQALAKDMALEEQELLYQQRREERALLSRRLAEETIKRELAEQAVKFAEIGDVDDTDGLDEEQEYAAWKERALARVKRDQEEQEQRAKEEAQVEERRQLPEAVRLEQDLAHVQAQRAKPKGQKHLLEKFYHRGAFFQGDESELMNRDYTVILEDQVEDVDMLPEVMQVRDFGKRGRSKWTHLTNEDTTLAADPLFQSKKSRRE